MTKKQFEAVLAQALEDCDETCEGKIARIETFEDAGVLTADPGLVVTFDDGSEIQLGIVRSRRCRDGSHPDETRCTGGDDPCDDEECEACFGDDDEDDGTLAYAARVNGIR